MAGEYISEKHAELVAAYKRAQQQTGRNAWTGRPDAANRIVTFDTRPRTGK
jgi:hypothetical protein